MTNADLIRSLSPRIRVDLLTLLSSTETKIKRQLKIKFSLVPEELLAYTLGKQSIIPILRSEIATYTGVPWGSITWRNKSKSDELVLARQAFAWWLRKKIGGYTLKQIATMLEYKEHTTVIHSVKQYGKLLKNKDAMVMGIHQYLTIHIEGELLKNP